jgi:hypothetical protein
MRTRTRSLTLLGAVTVATTIAVALDGGRAAGQHRARPPPPRIVAQPGPPRRQ